MMAILTITPDPDPGRVSPGWLICCVLLGVVQWGCRGLGTCLWFLELADE